MAKAANLIGQRFGKLLVIERLENNKKGNTMWLCQCDCGSKKIALGYDLTHGRTVSCGCLPSGKPSHSRVYLNGQRFGKLKVISLCEEKSSNGILVWKCQCDCGNIKYVRGINLKSGGVSSCGCIRKEKPSHNFKDLTEMKFGRLTVIEKKTNTNHGVMWLCKCDCGTEKIICGKDLKSGSTKSCGCLASQIRKNISPNFHPKVEMIGVSGMSRTRIYREYRSMISRCSPNYHYREVYYDKGISVCSEWIDKKMGFKNFLEWAMENGYSDNLTLDRRNNDDGYSPYNCRWVTMKEQQNNRSDNVIVEYMGERKTLKQWCEYLGLNYGMVKARRRNGWEIPRLFEPPHKNQYQ